MDRVTRYPIFNIPHSSRVSDLPTDLESHYTFDVVKVEPMSPSWDEDRRGMDSRGQSFQFDPEETSALRVVTVTQEIVPTSHMVKKTQHVVTDNYSAERHTPSWERKTQTEVVKVGPTYSLRAWPGERQPGRLYSQEEEEEERQLYLLGSGENAFPKEMKDFEREREAVIRGQVVKRSTTVATRWSSQEELDGLHPGQGPSSTSVSDSDSVIDTDQINFLAARQQFMNLEKLTASSWPAQKPRGRTGQPAVIQADVGQSISSSGSGRAGLTNGHTVSIRDDAEEARSGLRALTPGSQSISVDHLSVSSVEDALTLVFEEGPELVPCDEGPKETPIEREIRRAQEREADLRQQRGLQQSGSQDELVEIPIRPLLSTPTAKKGKDKGRLPSLYLQREIALDTKREEDHRQQAGLSELISDGSRASTPNQLARDSEFPKIRRVQSSDSILSLTSDTHPTEANLEGKKISRIPLEAYQPYLNPHSTKKEFPSYSSYKPGPSVGSGHLTMSSRWEQGVTTPPPCSQKVSWREEQVREQPWQSQTSTWREEQIREKPWKSQTSLTQSEEQVREQPWKSQTSTWREEQVREQPWKSQTSTWREEQVREQPWKSQTSTWREEQVREQPWKSQTSTWREEQVREQPWKSQTSTWREEQVREQPWKSQTSTWREEQVREQPWKSQTSTTQRQEPWRSPPQESTQKAWGAQERVAGDASQGVMPRDYFHLRPMKLKFTFTPGPEKVSAPKQERVWQPKIPVKEEVTIHAKPLRSQSQSEEQVREQPWKSQTSTWREEQVREQPWKSQTSTWREEQVREQPWKSQTSIWREEQVREQPWKSQTSIWREEQVREQPWKSQTSTWREEQVREQPWKSQTSTWREEQVREQPWKSQTSTWREEQVREQPWKSQTSTWREEQVREQPWKSQTSTWREEQVREQPWKSQTSTWREEQVREQPWKSQTSTWREEQVREQPWKSQTSTWREEQVREQPWKSQTSTWREEQVREQPWKSQTSTTQRQEPWRSPPQESTQKAWGAQERVAGDASRGVVSRDYFHLRPMKLKFTFTPGPEKVSAPKQERVWQPKVPVKEEVTIHAKPLRSQSSSLLEMEIQNVLQRERELEEERRNALFPEVFSPTAELDQTFEWEDSHSRHSSVASGVTGSYSVSESPTLSPVRFHSNLVWKVTEQSPGQDKSWKKRDVGYAGLDTSDTVDIQIMKATRVPRRKSALAARWEAGMYASEDED
ncbi:mitotic interactor and substrate of PLK1 [Antechinus flavipes]|uniref:mitotic interactor and substrate of PLK1 n=1 Tax=Antechinus flavipes TaxID=38775 RepID=UPI0022357D78|nr:mitotic interactor and substrate of PLK1 [Antechinus flavipes]